MPTFYFHFSDGHQTKPDDLGIEFVNLEQAYLEVCAAIPDIARDLLIERHDPLAASFKIADSSGRILMSVPFTEMLSGAEWRPVRARQRPYGAPRSTPARDDLALKSFRRMFTSVNAGCVLLTPELHVVEMNDFGARHSHVDAEAIRGVSIFEIFSELRGEPSDNFRKFMSLAQVGVVSEVIDLPYLVQDANGETANGWWNARMWPIFDDDGNLLGFVEWAEPHTQPTQGAKTTVRLSKSASE
jgi:PAS domain-containing protein